MPRQFPVPQPFAKGPRRPIPLHPVKSGQVAAIGYDQATKTLAVTFHRGNAVYHYPEVTQETFDAFKGAESIGTFFGAHIKSLPFEKFAPEVEAEPEKKAA